MAALTANRELVNLPDQTLRQFEVAASVRIFKGSFVGKNPAGYVKPFVPGDVFVGIAYEEANNSTGSAGSTVGGATTTGLVTVQTLGDFEMTVSGVAVSDAGRPVFATTDGDVALTGHPDACVGHILHKNGSNLAVIRLREPGVRPSNGEGCAWLSLTGSETFQPTGIVAATLNGPAGFEIKSALGLGVLHNDAEDGGVKLQFDAEPEIALASLRSLNDTFPVDKGITMRCRLVVSDKGNDAALDIDWGLGTALTINSEADIDHADMAQLAGFHMDGNSDNILAQSDDATTDVAVVDTTIDNDSATDVPKEFEIIVRPSGSVEFWIDKARVLSSTTFALLSTAVVAPFVNVEKTNNGTSAVLILSDLDVAGGKV